MSAVVVSSSSHSTEAVTSFSGSTLAVHQMQPMIGTEVDYFRPLTGMSRERSGQNQLRHFVVKRRLKGFVTDTHGETWRVMFIEGGKKIPYELPSVQLRKSGVELRYQPFEMDEMESTLPNVSGKIYRFRALAAVKDAFLDTLPLDSERQHKRDLILSRFGKPQA